MKTIEKTLEVLEAFLNYREEPQIGITRLVELTGYNASTVHRILSTLVRYGYLSQHRSRAKYSLGPKFIQFGNIVASRLQIKDIAFPFMVKLNREVNECVNLVTLDSNEAVYLECIEPAEQVYKLRIFTQVGARVPLYCTGVGKVLLAYMNENDLEKYLDRNELVSRTPNTITDRAQLIKELADIRREGYSVDDEEMELGVRCVAAPVHDMDGGVYAVVSISGPSTRLTNAVIRELQSSIKDCVSKISLEMGVDGTKISSPV